MRVIHEKPDLFFQQLILIKIKQTFNINDFQGNAKKMSFAA